MEVIETVPFIKTSNPIIQSLFRDIQETLRQRILLCFFGHLRAHSNLPGPLTEGNDITDRTTRLVLLSQEQLAQQSHNLHHQNSNSLRLQFKISREAARQIVRQCPRCPEQHNVPQFGINPRGLLPNHLWQMDVTHIPAFGRLSYVHVTMDTFSGFLMATAQAGEAGKHCIAHCLRCFAVMGQPKCIKTDNGPGYTGRQFQTFCQTFSIQHKTGIPYKPSRTRNSSRKSKRYLKKPTAKNKKGGVISYIPVKHPEPCSLYS